jgi:Periplasmic component of the Tol biopolymer transport system
VSHRFLRSSSAFAFIAACLFTGLLAAQSSPGKLGLFEGQADIGKVTPAGTAKYSPKAGAYTLTAAGYDLWAAEDDFHFVWKKLAGDQVLTADIDFPVKTGNHHRYRKAVLMFRQSLDPDSAYADVAVHGAGMTALQYRRAKGAATQDIEINTASPSRVRLEKRGDVFTMFVAENGGALHQVGASIKLRFDEPFLVGIGVCAHSTSEAEKAVFSNVELKPVTEPANPAKLALYSTLQTISIADSARQATVLVSEKDHRLMAPNWSRDGKTIVFTQGSAIALVPASGGTVRNLDIGGLVSCSGSHGFSPDGKLFALSCATPDRNDRRVFIIPSEGGSPRQLTENTGYFHSWSPDGRTILYTRGNKGTLTIYSMSVDGGPETALTSGKGVDDDPDYSPDGKYIYFNTDRWGGNQIARMLPDGGGVEQMTFDEHKNWTPHPSPDGKSIVFLSYDPSVTTHAANKDIALRILTPADGKIRTLVNLVGGDGTMNVANWSPDSKSITFVSYQMLPAEDNGATQ